MNLQGHDKIAEYAKTNKALASLNIGDNDLTDCKVVKTEKDTEKYAKLLNEENNQRIRNLEFVSDILGAGYTTNLKQRDHRQELDVDLAPLLKELNEMEEMDAMEKEPLKELDDGEQLLLGRTGINMSGVIALAAAISGWRR